ncbi:MAG: class I SAM-dependent methyltransferase [Actinomycetota bacterium]|nr:class I SAM-dependent methyltransferase [Actinomycetota bacterium]
MDRDTARTLDSFGYEWTAFDRIQPEDEEYWHWYFADVPLDELGERRGLDVGCGKGRYSRFTAHHLASLVALDGSRAVETAKRNLADLDNVSVVRADVRTMPFPPASFGFVACLGVLHHLPDPRDGLRRLVELLAPSGLVLLYLYSRPSSRNLRAATLGAATVLRRATVHLPHRLLRALAAPIAAGLYLAFVVPGRWLPALPLAIYRNKPLRSLWLDTFDRLSAPLENRYVWADLEPWFQEMGLVVESARDEAGWFIVARKPVP